MDVGRPARPVLQTAAMLYIGATAVIALGVQSAMYGSLERSGQVTVAEIGVAAAGEMISLALGVVAAGTIARKISLPVLACIGASALVLTNLCMPYADHATLIALRMGAGVGGGILLWLANAYIVLSRRVVQLAAMFLIAQTAIQFAVAASAAAFARASASAIPLIMAACGIAAFMAVPATRGWSALPENHTSEAAVRFDLRGIMAMLIMGLLQFSLVGGWILVELVGAAKQVSAGAIAAATPIMLGAQVVGGLAAMALTNHIRWNTAMIGVGITLAGIQLAMVLASTEGALLGLSFGYGLLWNFALPQLTPMSMAADPTLRVARVGPAAVVAGAALGPLVSATLAGVAAPAAATMAFAVPSLMIGVAAILLKRRIGSLQRSNEQ